MPSFALWSLILSIPLGALGWVATNFVARPILRAYELREKVWEEMLVTANVSMLDGARFQQSGESLRRLAAQASAIDAAWPHPLRWLLKRLRLDLNDASTSLLGLSNTFGVSPDAWNYRRSASVALGLPTDFTTRKGTAPDSANKAQTTAA
jgi:hypothetical protein